MSVESVETQRRFPRRLLIGAATVVAAAGATQIHPEAAEAASGSTAWKLGGNSGVTTTGSNFIGPTNVAPLVFKTRSAKSKPMSERMRITPAGLLGVGTKTPGAQVDVRTSSPVAIRGTSTSASGTSVGVAGVTTVGAAVSGTSKNGIGVQAQSTNGYGMYTKGAYGIIAYSNTGGIASYATGGAYGSYCYGSTYGTYTSGGTYGLYASGPTGVYGSGTVNGVTGVSSSTGGNAVYGNGGQYGVRGEKGSTAGVRGDSAYVGVWGQAPTYGVYGYATGSGYGLYGQGGTGSYALWAQGNVHVNGTLSKAAGSFKIDHPLAPGEKWLSHSFVESPDMMNVYNGNVSLDADGTATVELPDYFSALNKDFRYQLTTVGAFAPVYVASKISDGRFSIAGGTDGLEVSWQVTGIRQDDYAKAHPIEVETAKTSDDRGTRQFVPKGSSARAMKTGPGKAPESAKAPTTTLGVPKPPER